MIGFLNKFFDKDKISLEKYFYFLEMFNSLQEVEKKTFKIFCKKSAENMAGLFGFSSWNNLIDTTSVKEKKSLIKSIEKITNKAKSTDRKIQSEAYLLMILHLDCHTLNISNDNPYSFAIEQVLNEVFYDKEAKDA